MRIAPGFELPPSAVTETFAMLAKRGMGKSNAAVVMAEEMWDAGYQWVAIDPKGDWWGIRSSADGKGQGLPVPVFGGRHGDLPLDATAGALMARLIVERSITAVLDVSLFSKADQIRFVTDFAETLFRAAGDDPRPLHLFLEEAEEFLPQRVDARAARMVGAYSKIAKQGRTLGLGVTLITQRSASLNKDALSQTDTLILFRTVSPHDRRAVVAWAEHHDEAKEVAASLAELRPGESWVLSPGFLGRIERVTWRRRRTFDSGATPVTGARRATPVSLADIDLAEIKDLMAETVEKARADDPKELRKRIRDLERQLADRPAETVEVPVEVEVRVEVPTIPDGLLGSLTSVQDALAGAIAAVEAVPTVPAPAQRRPIPAPKPAIAAPVRREPRPAPREAGAVEGDVSLGKAHKAVLIVLARFPDGRNKRQVAAMAQLKSTGGHFGNVLSNLRTNGLIVGQGDGPYRITAAGLDALGTDYEPLPTGQALLDWWMAQLGKAHRAVLARVVDAWPATIDRLTLAEEVGLDANGGHYGNVLSNLRTRALISGTSHLSLDPDFAAAIA